MPKFGNGIKLVKQKENFCLTFGNPVISTISRLWQKVKTFRFFVGFCHVDFFSVFGFRLFICFPFKCLFHPNFTSTTLRQILNSNIVLFCSVKLLQIIYMESPFPCFDFQLHIQAWDVPMHEKCVNGPKSEQILRLC